MINQSLQRYLNDHSAGAKGALALMKHLEQQYPEPAIANFITQLRADVESDERQLQMLIERLGVEGSGIRQAASWLTEEAAQLKLMVDDPSGGALRLLESLEVLSLGIEGKLALWRSLLAVAPDVPELSGVDYESLSQRAREQRERVEPHRLAAARAALATTPAS